VKTWSEPRRKSKRGINSHDSVYNNRAHKGYFPSGGGIYGSDGAGPGIFNLGYPSHEAILKLARPIMVPVRQNFAVESQFFTVGSTNALTLLNSGSSDDEKVIMFGRNGQDRLAA